MKRIAIIGAGLAGLTLAREINASADVHVFEKYHGVGGRMAHRHLEGFDFDHGAQYSPRAASLSSSSSNPISATVSLPNGNRAC